MTAAIIAEHARLNRHLIRLEKAYDAGTPLVTDGEYDALHRRRDEMEAEHPELAKRSSSHRPAGDPGKVKHSTPMLSLEKVLARDGTAALDKFMKPGTHYCVTAKMDGLAAEIRFNEAGAVRDIITRGDGIHGESIKHNHALIYRLPRDISRLEVRGELVISKENFAKLNKAREAAGLEPFANPRNAVAGMMRQKHGSFTTPYVDFVAYGFADRFVGKTQMEEMLMLSSSGFETPCFTEVVRSSGEAAELIQQATDGRSGFRYEIDGVVIRINDNKDFHAAGTTSRAPKGAVAWKFPDKPVETIIEAVDYQIGRTGVITPVAKLKPVEVSGAVVRKATLHNMLFMEEMDIAVGDVVRLVRSGEVIPKIVSVDYDQRDPDAESFYTPDYCPSCNTKLVWDHRDLRCVSHDCIETRLAALEHFCSRDVMNVKGISRKTLEKILRHGKVMVPADLFALTLDDFIAMNDSEGTTNPDGEHADAKAKMKAIDDARRTTLARAIYSLGIRGLGRSVAQTLAAQPNAEAFVQDADFNALTMLDGIGAETANAIHEFFHGPEEPTYTSRDHLQRLKANGVVWGRSQSESTTTSDGPLSGKKVVITGSVEGYTREEAQERARELGAEVLSSVSKKVDLIIVGKKPGNSKMVKGTELGIDFVNAAEVLS